MKPPALLLFLLLAFLTTTTTLPSLALTAENNKSPVLDTNGNAILSGGEFYVLPAYWGYEEEGGGVYYRTTGKQITCAVPVWQAYYNEYPGFQVKLTLKEDKSSDGMIYEETPISFAFLEKPDCAKSSEWMVVLDDNRVPYVVIGDPGHYETEIKGDFHLRKQRRGYKLMFCQQGYPPTGFCYQVSRADDKPERRLILTEHGDDPYKVVFQRGFTHSMA